MYKLNKNFNKFIYGIGGIPSTYIESLTYEEQLLWFCKNLSDLIQNVDLALTFDSYQDMIYQFNNLDKDSINKGQQIYIKGIGKLDLYVSDISNTSITYHYSSDDDIINALASNSIQVGYYVFNAIEGYTNLSSYVTNDNLNSTLSNYVTLSNLNETLTDYELLNNKVTTLSASSTDTEYPSAKCVYDIIGDVESLLSEV